MAMESPGLGQRYPHSIQSDVSFASSHNQQDNGETDKELSSPPFPSSPKQQQQQQPRGCRFRNLDEAHRNITGRSLPRSTDTSVVEASVVDASKSSASSQRKGSSGNGIRFGGEEEKGKQKETENENENDRQPGITLQDIMQNGTSSSTPDSPLSQAALSDTTDSSVERLYQRYQLHMENESPAGVTTTVVHVVPPPPPPPPPREGATTRCGFREEELSDDSGRRNVAVGKNKKEPKDEEDASTAEDSLLPMPLRVQSLRGEPEQAEFRCGTAASAGGATTDSEEEDPFRYDENDNDSRNTHKSNDYAVFLQPSKEREVRAALKRISGLSEHSQATFYSQEDGMVTAVSLTEAMKKTSSRPPPIPSVYLEDGLHSNQINRTNQSQNDVSMTSGGRSPTPDSGVDGFYDSSVIRPNWTAEGGTYEVKVVLQDGRSQERDESGRTDQRNERDNRDQRDQRDQRDALTGKNLSRHFHRPSRRDSERDRDDWETVATTTTPGLAGLASSRPRMPLLLASSPPLPPPGGGFKITGSSVADVSDEDNEDNEDNDDYSNSYGDGGRPIPFDAYASTDRIVQHPSGGDVPSLGVSDDHRRPPKMKIPVMLPQHRVHRVNGFAQEPAMPKITNPFRRPPSRMGGRPLQQQQQPLPLLPLSPQMVHGTNRFGFRGSQMTEEEETNAHHISSSTPTTQRSSEGTVHSFPFHLIPLPEAAARMQAASKSKSKLPNTNALLRGSSEPSSQGYIRMPEPIYGSSNSNNNNNSNTNKRNPFARKQLPHAPTQVSALSSTTAGSTWATMEAAPLGSVAGSGSSESKAGRRRYKPATRLFGGGGGGGSRVSVAESTWPKISLSPTTPTRQKAAAATNRILRRSHTPRLYPWDYPRQRQERQQQQGTDPELRAVANGDPSSLSLSVTDVTTMHDDDLERSGIPLDAEAFLTREARRQRRTWFLGVLVAACLFPFVAVLAYLGKLDSGLSWYTRGGAARLSRRQRRALLVTLVVQCAAWPSVLAVVVWKVQNEPI